MAASFYSSPLIGATTTLACFAHEIPHEIADYSILIRSGFTKKQAMQSQFLTAVGAFVGYVVFPEYLKRFSAEHVICSTFIGIGIHNLSTSDGEAESLNLAAGVRQNANGLLGTTVQLSDLVGVQHLLKLFHTGHSVHLWFPGHTVRGRRFLIHRSCGCIANVRLLRVIYLIFISTKRSQIVGRK